MSGRRMIDRSTQLHVVLIQACLLNPLSISGFTGPGESDPPLNTYTSRTNRLIYPALSVDVQVEELPVR